MQEAQLPGSVRKGTLLLSFSSRQKPHPWPEVALHLQRHNTFLDDRAEAAVHRKLHHTQPTCTTSHSFPQSRTQHSQSAPPHGSTHLAVGIMCKSEFSVQSHAKRHLTRLITPADLRDSAHKPTQLPVALPMGLYSGTYACLSTEPSKSHTVLAHSCRVQSSKHSTLS